jgi:hypothetical protein
MFTLRGVRASSDYFPVLWPPRRVSKAETLVSPPGAATTESPGGGGTA